MRLGFLAAFALVLIAPAAANEQLDERRTQAGDLLIIEVIPEKKPPSVHEPGKPSWYPGKVVYEVGESGRICVCYCDPVLEVIGLSTDEVAGLVRSRLLDHFGEMTITVESLGQGEVPEFTASTSIPDASGEGSDKPTPRIGWRVFEGPSELNEKGWAIVGLLRLGDAMPTRPASEDERLQYVRLTSFVNEKAVGSVHQVNPAMTTGTMNFFELPGFYGPYGRDDEDPTKFAESLRLPFDYKAAGFSEPVVLVLFRQFFPEDLTPAAFVGGGFGAGRPLLEQPAEPAGPDPEVALKLLQGSP